MADYSAISQKLKCARLSDINEVDGGIYKDGDRVTILGLLSSVKKKITKNDSTMAFLTVEDTTSATEVIVFPKTLLDKPNLFFEGNILLIHGRVSMREDEDTKIVCEVVEPCPSESSIMKPSDKQEKEKKKAKGLFLRFDNSSSPQIEVCEKLLLIFDGTVPLYYFFNDKKEYKRNPIGQSIDVNPVLIRELRKILGESNVIYNQ
jgi:DNA polymerase-3 subunit alpha